MRTGSSLLVNWSELVLIVILMNNYQSNIIMSIILYGSLNPNDVIGEVTLANLQNWFVSRQRRFQMGDSSEEFDMSYLQFRRLLDFCRGGDFVIRGIRIQNSDDMDLFLVIQGKNRIWDIRDDGQIHSVSQKLLQLRDEDRINFIFTNRLPPPPADLNDNPRPYGITLTPFGIRMPNQQGTIPLDEVTTSEIQSGFPIRERLYASIADRDLPEVEQNQLFSSDPNYPYANDGIEKFTVTDSNGNPVTIPGSNQPVTIDNLNVYLGQKNEDGNWLFWLIVIIVIIIIIVYYNRKKINS